MTVANIVSFNGGVFYLPDNSYSTLSLTDLTVNNIETINNGGVVHSFTDSSLG